MALPSAGEVLAFFEANKEEAVTLRALIDAFGVQADDRRAFRALIADLADAEKIVRIKSKLYKAKHTPLEKPEWTTPSKPRGKKPAPEQKLSKGGIKLGIEPTQLVGVVQHMAGKVMAACAYGDELEYIPLTGDSRGLKKNDAAVFEIIETKQKRVAQVALALGAPSEPRVEVLRAALSRGFRATFSEEALSAASAFSPPGDADLTHGRQDLRARPFVTIDGEDAKDFDDAVYAERHGDGFRLYVAIADVSHYVRPKSAIDREGFHRGTSVYFPGFVLPMLPHTLSDDLCSLRPEVPRLTLCCEMQVDGSGEVVSEKVYHALIRSAARLTYNQVEAALHKGEDNPAKRVGEPLVVFAECARRLREAKTRRGAIDLDLDEPQLQLGPDGRPTGSVARARLEAHRLIEDAMLAANSAVARVMHRHKWPAAYRVHEAPNDEKLTLVRLAAEGMGYRHPLPDGPTTAQVAKFVRALQNEPKGPILLPLVLRAMARARYGSERLGHYALAAADYLHFTSPIRRFPDLVVHRSFTTSGRDAPTDIARACQWMSEREQSAERCEREVDDYYRCLLAEPLVGQEFDAVVTGVLDFGAFVRMEQPYLEGLIPVRSFGEDFYVLDELGLRLRGRRSGHSIGLGDRIRVKLTEARPLRRQIAFQWLPKKELRDFREGAPSADRGQDFLARARAKAAAGGFGPPRRGDDGPRREDDRPRRGRDEGPRRGPGGKSKFSRKRRK